MLLDVTAFFGEWSLGITNWSVQTTQLTIIIVVVAVVVGVVVVLAVVV
jgi:hypothetical protein